MFTTIFLSQVLGKENGLFDLHISGELGGQVWTVGGSV